MKTVTIRLTMMTDNVKNFVSLVNRYPYDMDLRSAGMWWMRNPSSVFSLLTFQTDYHVDLQR